MTSHTMETGRKEEKERLKRDRPARLNMGKKIFFVEYCSFAPYFIVMLIFPAVPHLGRLSYIFYLKTTANLFQPFQCRSIYSFA